MEDMTGWSCSTGDGDDTQAHASRHLCGEIECTTMETRETRGSLYPGKDVPDGRTHSLESKAGQGACFHALPGRFSSSHCLGFFLAQFLLLHGAFLRRGWPTLLIDRRRSGCDSTRGPDTSHVWLLTSWDGLWRLPSQRCLVCRMKRTISRSVLRGACDWCVVGFLGSLGAGSGNLAFRPCNRRLFLELGPRTVLVIHFRSRVVIATGCIVVVIPAAIVVSPTSTEVTCRVSCRDVSGRPSGFLHVFLVLLLREFLHFFHAFLRHFGFTIPFQAVLSGLLDLLRHHLLMFGAVLVASDGHLRVRHPRIAQLAVVASFGHPVLRHGDRNLAFEAAASRNASSDTVEATTCVAPLVVEMRCARLVS